MKLICSFFVLMSILILLDGRKFRCDYQYFSKPDFHLKYHEIPSNWHEAQLRCYMEGAVLASPLTAALKDAMLAVVANKTKTGIPGIFTGIHSKFSRGDFFSIEGIPLSRIDHDWAAGEPNNENDTENCLAMVANGNFLDVSCKKTLPYICYRKFELTMTECGTTDSEYKLDPRTGSCYKFHRYPRNWSRAFMTCAAEGGYLAIINSDKEAQVIRDIYAKYPDLSGVGDYHVGIAHIGFHDWDEHGEWRTIHGQSLQEAGYAKFHPGEPNNASSQFCGGVYKNGMLDDFWCHRRAAFFCEKDPENLACHEEDNNERRRDDYKDN